MMTEKRGCFQPLQLHGMDPLQNFDRIAKYHQGRWRRIRLEIAVAMVKATLDFQDFERRSAAEHPKLCPLEALAED